MHLYKFRLREEQKIPVSIFLNLWHKIFPLSMFFLNIFGKERVAPYPHLITKTNKQTNKKATIYMKELQMKKTQEHSILSTLCTKIFKTACRYKSTVKSSPIVLHDKLGK